MGRLSFDIACWITIIGCPLSARSADFTVQNFLAPRAEKLLLSASTLTSALAAHSSLAPLRGLALLKESGTTLIPGKENSPEIRFAAIGDSLSRDFEIKNILQFIWDSHIHQNGGPLLDLNANAPYSLVERWRDQGFKIEAHNFARNNSTFFSNKPQNWREASYDFVQNLATAEVSLKDQIQSVLALPRPPNIISIWLGHNDANAFARVTSADQFRAGIQPQGAIVEINDELNRLVRALSTHNEPTAIVIFAPLSADSFREVREKIRNTKAFQRSQLFAGLRDSHFESFGLILDWFADEIQKTVVQFNASRSANSNIKFFYSDSIRNLRLSDPSLISTYDGIHPSKKGQNLIAEAMHAGIQPAVEWLFSAI